MATDIHGPVLAIIMPLNHEGHGPCSKAEATLTTWEVWDQVCQTICTCRDRDDAKLIADLINIRNDWPLTEIADKGD